MKSYFKLLGSSLNLSMPEDYISPERKYKRVRDSLKYIYPSVLKNWKKGLITYLLLVVVSVLSYPMPMINRYLIDDVLIAKELHLLVPVLAVMLAVSGASVIANQLKSYYSARFNQEVILDIQHKLLSRIFSLPKAFFDRIHKGYLMSRLTSDVNGVEWFFSGEVVQLVMQFFKFIGGIFFLFYLEWKLAIPVVLSLPFPFIATIFFAKRSYVLSHRNRERQARYYSVFQEIFSSIFLIKAFSREKKAEKEIVDSIRAENKASNEQMVISSINNAVMTAMPSVAKFFVLIFGSYFVINGTWSVGSLLAFLAYLSFVYGPATYLASSANQFQYTRAALERVSALFDLLPEENAETGENIDRLKGDIEFRDVCFEYEKNKRVLNSLSFKASAGERWAVVGKSGVGKTTLISLIMKFYNPLSGHIIIDGKDSSYYNVRSLRKRIGFVSQNTQLFSGTVIDNLKLGNEEASIEDAVKAARIAGIHDFIDALPDKYNTIIEEAGANLSEGQKQRLSIARALIKSPDILIMDEPTSALDNITEQAIYSNLPECIEGKTSFTIAHRLNTVKSADKIIFLRHDKEALIGSHEELIKNEEYREFFKITN